MAKKLSKTGIVTNQLILPPQITQSINALTGVEPYDINVSGSLAITGSTTITLGNLTILDSSLGNGKLTVTDIQATNMNVINLTSSFVTASKVFTSGSNVFGDEPTDTHEFIGDIIADNNISASQNITSANLAVATGGKIGLDTLTGNDYITLNSNNDIEIYRDGTKRITIDNTYFSINADTSITGSITASGNISSSGILSASEGSFTSSLSTPLIQNPGNLGAPFNLTEIKIGKENAKENLNVSGRITASLDVSASGDIYGANIITSNITASGNISSSGDIYAPNIEFKGNSSINSFDTGILSISSNNNQRISLTATQNQLTNKEVLIHSSAGKLTVQGTITASGDIETDSNLEVRGNITASGNISASGTISASKAHFPTITNDNIITTNITASGNISASGTISASKAHFPTITNDNIITTNITASGNISASGFISASEAHFGGSSTTINDNITTAEITASGIISASTSIIANNITASNAFHAQAHNGFEFTISGSNFNMINETPDKSLFFKTSTGTGTINFGTNNANSDVKIGTGGSITASGDISVSGNVTASDFKGKGTGLTNIPAASIVGLNLSQITGGTNKTASISNDGLRVNTDTIITGSLTASGNISASGNVTASDFKGKGTGLTDIPSTSIIGLNLSQITGGTNKTASISNDGLRVNTNVTITGSLTASGDISASRFITKAISKPTEESTLTISDGFGTPGDALATFEGNATDGATITFGDIDEAGTLTIFKIDTQNSEFTFSADGANSIKALNTDITASDFKGKGTGLTNIPSTSIVGLNLSQITGGTNKTASINNKGLFVNTNTIITGSLTASLGSNLNFSIGSGKGNSINVFKGNQNQQVIGDNEGNNTGMYLELNHSENSTKLKGSTFSEFTSNKHIFNKQTDDPSFTILSLTGSLNASSDITSSGNISASGDITASNITATTGSFSHLIGNSPITLGSNLIIPPSVKIESTSSLIETKGVQINIVSSGTGKEGSDNVLLANGLTSKGAGTFGNPEYSLFVGSDTNLNHIEYGTAGGSANVDHNFKGNITASAILKVATSVESPLFEGISETNLGNVDNNTNILAGDQLTNQANSIQFKAESGTYIFNEGEIDADLIFYDSTETELVRFDAGEARVGIKTSSPTAVLDVNGNINATEITSSGIISSSDSLYIKDIFVNEGSKIYLDGSDSTPNTYIKKSGTSVNHYIIGSQRLQLGFDKTRFLNSPVEMAQSLIVNSIITSSGNIETDSGVITGKSGVTVNGKGGTVTAETGSFNHIITDGETIEFRTAGSSTKIGSLKFDATNGLEVKDSAGNEGKLKTKELNIPSGGNMVINATDVNFNNLPSSDPEVAGRLFKNNKIASGFVVVCISQG